jgi:hypothetical protein
MSETLQIWLFGVLGAWMVVLTGGFFRMWTTLTEVKTTMVLTSKEAAKILHSPEDHLGIDKLLEKWIATVDRLHGRYIERDCELTYEEWLELKEACENIISNDRLDANTRMAALLVRWPMDLAKHKILISKPTPAK